MSNRVGRFVDGELLVVGWLTWFLALPSTSISTSLPDPIPAGGAIRVRNAGGPSDWDNARPRIDVETLVPGGDGSAVNLAGLAHNAVGVLGDEKVFNGQLVHCVNCISVPVHRFWSDEVDRLVATYQLDLPVL